MYCTKCGVHNADTHKQCRACGAKLKSPDVRLVEDNASARQKGKGRRRAYAVAVSVLAAAVILSAALPSVASAWYQADGFAVTVSDGRFLSPEAAVEFYIGALTELDIEAALAACAVNEYAGEFDAESAFVRMHMISPTIAAPNQYAFYQAMNQAAFLGTITSMMKRFIYSFTDSEAAQAVLAGTMYPLSEDPAGQALEFVESVDPSVIRELNVVSIDLPNPDMFNSENHQRNCEATARIYGAEEITDRVALYEFDGSYYYSGFQTARYEDCWKIISLTSPLGKCTSFGNAQAITHEEYKALVS